jgi:hypothetical protein
LTLLAGSLTARAGDLALKATLVRGANDAAASGQFPLASAKLSAGLRRNFQWTNYYQVTNLTVAIPLNESRQITMGDHCTLKIKNLDSSRVAIDCIDQGKQISKGTNTLPFIMGIDGQNNTAWFVSLEASDAKTGSGPNATAKK